MKDGSKDRLDAARGAGDHADRARRRNRANGRVSHSRIAQTLPERAFEVRESTALTCELHRRALRFTVQKRHDSLTELARLDRVVRMLELKQEIRETHHAKTDLA